MQPDHSNTLLLCLGLGSALHWQQYEHAQLLNSVGSLQLALGASFWDVSSTTSRPPASRGGCSSAGPLAAHVGSAAYAS